MYFSVQGQLEMQIPHMVSSMPILAIARSRAAAAQAKASKNESRGTGAFQFFPEGAFPGQDSTQSVQSPQREPSTGVAASSSASVRTEVILIAEPNSSVTRRAHLPIHPRLETRPRGNGLVRKKGALRCRINPCMGRLPGDSSASKIFYQGRGILC